MDFQDNCSSVVSMAVEEDGALVDKTASESTARVMTATVHATHNAIKAEDLSVFIGARCLLANTELKIAEQQRATQATPSVSSKTVQRGTCHGLVGVNGCGKSTLLSLIAERRLPVPPTWDVFLVNQHLPTPKCHCPVEEVLTADTNRMRLVNEQATLEEQMIALAEEGDLQLLQEANERLVELHSELAKWDDAEKDVTRILLALGFRGSGHVGVGHSSEPTLDTPMNELSGGWRMKVQLAKALWLQPKLLLLDEPTNHLDFHALQWLQEQLEQYPHTTIVVSHDVSFLYDVCREIIWMKDLKLESLPRDTVSQEDLLRMQRRKALNFNFCTPEENDAENHGLSLHGVEFSYNSTSSSSRQPHHLQVKKEIRFSGGSRSVLLGKNGSGKSTFLDLCAGKLRPTRGNIDRTQDLKIGHYSQLTDDLDKNSVDTAASYLVRECPDELAAHAGSTRTTRLQRAEKHSNQHLSEKAAAQQKRLLEIARGVLSRFGFEGDAAVAVPVNRLSGGQKALLKFAVLSLRPAHILMLDEPTNHLDAEACEALARGLSEFKGGVVAVTHDELLIYRLIHCNWSASELLICRGGTVWRERNFGAHCLNALKNEVHRAEEIETQSGRQKQPSPAPESRDDAKAVTVAAKSELPPWLQPRRRAKAKNEEPAVSDIPPASPQKVEQQFEETSTALANRSIVRRQPTLATTPQISTGRQGGLPTQPDVKECKVDTIVSSESKEQKNKSLNTGVPDTWEEANESDASTNVPEGMDEAEEPGEVCHEKAPVVPKEKNGRHSRFRKDMVNFNKAVLKWLRQEEQGAITNPQVINLIRNSHVAQQLRASRGEEFDEDRFVQDALAHAKNLLVR